MPENTDNAGGLVVIYVVFGNGIEKLKTLTHCWRSYKEKWYTRRESNPKPSDP